MMHILRIRINSKDAFNKMLHKSYPLLSIRCNRFNAYLDNDIELTELAKLVFFRSGITVEDINRINNAEYFEFLNELYGHIEKNKDMIGFWLL